MNSLSGGKNQNLSTSPVVIQGRRRVSLFCAHQLVKHLFLAVFVNPSKLKYTHIYSFTCAPWLRLYYLFHPL